MTTLYRDSTKRFWSKRKKKGISYKGLQPFNLTFSNGSSELLGSKETFKYYLTSNERKIIFPESLESIRLTINKLLVSRLGKTNYHLRICKYPHRILREHRMAKGVKADRISEGMRRAFGKATRRGIQVQKGNNLIELSYLKNQENIMKKLMNDVSKTTSKLSVRSSWKELKN